MQIVNATNGTMRFDERQREDAENSLQSPMQILIPTTLFLQNHPSNSSNETIPFPEQPSLILRDGNGDFVQELVGNWTVSASLQGGDPLARLEGNLTVPFINGTANFTNLAISHNGTGYTIVYRVSSPADQNLQTSSYPHVILERNFKYRFDFNRTKLEVNVLIAPGISISVYDIADGSIVVDTEWKNLTWQLNVSLIIASNSQVSSNLVGNLTVPIYQGRAMLDDLSISEVGTYYLQFTITTDPSSSYGTVYMTEHFQVTSFDYYLYVVQEPGNCNETVVCGDQPVIEVRNSVTNLSVAGLTDNGRMWIIEASLCDDNGGRNPLKGTTRNQLNSSRLEYTNLYIDHESVALYICFNLTVSPPSPRYQNLTAISNAFEVKRRILYMFELLPPDQVVQSEVFGQQPVIEIRDMATQQSAFPLLREWTVTASLLITDNDGILGGNLTVNVTKGYANFTDLNVNSFGNKFILFYTSNQGVNVSI